MNPTTHNLNHGFKIKYYQFKNHRLGRERIEKHILQIKINEGTKSHESTHVISIILELVAKLLHHYI